MRQIPSSATLLVAALAVLLTGPLVAQQPSAEEVFVGRVEVNVVNVEVYVTDKDGHPVTGLTREDFELYEDGERVEITNFFAVEDGALTRSLTRPGPFGVYRLLFGPDGERLLEGGVTAGGNAAPLVPVAGRGGALEPLERRRGVLAGRRLRGAPRGGGHGASILAAMPEDVIATLEGGGGRSGP